MKSVVMPSLGEIDYSADAKTIPVPENGEVLIKVECAVLNPSDLYQMQGNYRGNYDFPLTPGGEGSGTVIQSGGGMLAWYLINKKVGFVRKGEKAGKYSVGGAYAEYIVTKAT